jgi:hypothetical protein
MNTSSKTHPSWEKESSLTSPEDRTSTREKPWRPDQASRSLTEAEVDSAITQLVDSSITKRFPRVDRTFADPPPPNQTYGLISFVPAKGATPNPNGIYGFVKLRGNYPTEIEANQRCEFIIRNVDSYHNIQTCYVGRPVPVTIDPKYAAETSEIDIRKQTAESISADVKSRKEQDQKEMREIKAREEALLKESDKARANETVQDPYDTYITLRVKKAQLTWTYGEHIKKMAEIVPILARTRKEIEDLNKTYPDFKDTYFEKYRKAREDSGIKEAPESSRNSFIQYMVEDLEYPEVEVEYQKLVGGSSDGGESKE